MIRNLERIGKVLILLFFLSTSISAQSPKVKFERLSTEHGLSHSSVYCIFQDRKGFLWFGTENGLNRYDGYQFTTYYYEPDDTTSLSNSWVWSILEDHTGTLWVGTVDGLNQFDRNRDCFVRYKHDPGNPASLSCSYVRVILEDHAGTLWIGTTNGLNRFDRDTGKFISYNRNTDNPEHLGGNYILTICEDQSQTLWVGTQGGLFRYDREKDALIPSEEWRELMTNKPLIVSALYQDRLGMLWIGTWGWGTAHKRPGWNQTIVSHDNWLNIPAGNLSFCEDHSGTLWIAANRLSQLNRETGLLAEYQYDPKLPTSISSPQIRAIYESRHGENGVLWFGTFWGGVSKLVQKQKKFVNYRPEFKNLTELNQNRISALVEGQDGEFWVGTAGSGLYQFDRETKNSSHYRIDPLWAPNTSPDFIEALCVDQNGELWVGASYSGGLHRYDRKRDRFTHFLHDPKNPFSLSLNHISAIHEDRFGILWVGTDGGGLNQFDRNQERFIRYQHQPQDSGSLSSNKVKIIFEDSSGVLWIGTWGGGLNKFDRERDKFVRYQHEPGNPNSLSDNRIMTICESPAGVLWIGTSSAGLNRFDCRDERFTSFTVKDGLPSNNIYGMLSDDRGNLWISTDKGLSKFNIATKIFRNYDAADGLPGDEFSERAFCKSKTGELFFGGRHGFTAFYPDSIQDNPFVPPIVLTDFKIMNKPAELDTAIAEKKHIVLRHDENFLSFEFAALNYVSPEKNQYRYKMEGVDQDWIYSGNPTGVARRFANYTGIAPGDYVFKVRGSNNDGVWNEQGASVRITINPPWWRTNWAYAIYALLIGTALYVVRRLERHRFQTLNELKMQRFEAQKLFELDQAKSRFFANISHEFRTPLTLILGPIEKMLARAAEGETKQDLSMIQRNARRLLQLINQLLDLSKLETGRMQLRARAEDVKSLLKGLVLSFASLAERKKITLKFDEPDETITAYLDRDKFEKIVANLLSNAFKFTPEEGKIEVAVAVAVGSSSHEGFIPATASATANFFAITIKDTGIGMPADQLTHIFDRFYQVDNSHTREHAPLDRKSATVRAVLESAYPTGHEGTGIGLALAKELVELHGGKILVESELFKGSVFTVLLPLGRAHLRDEEIVESSEQLPVCSEQLSVSSDQHQASIIEQPATSNQLPATSNEQPATRRGTGKKPFILIIDDNSDVRRFIRSHLDQDYHILEAADGAEGLQKAIEKMPDLIISDVMMPKMDGIELCRQVKTDERTSHIPVILLTARASGESKVEGLETGADDYITKPFDARELLVRVKNLIEQRRKLRERFRREMSLQPREVTVNSMDEQFLQRALDIVEKHLSDSEFGVETFSKQIGMSRQHLNRKLQALTEHSANDFIRIIRLKRAAQLLEKRSATVTEIAYEVGFNNPAYFAECFRKEFGRSPSQYARS
jgi:signal transduction histidine kinase/ligand-binding sensor domain-containing protein/DNA-binding response OmpR family regulator